MKAVYTESHIAGLQKKFQTECKAEDVPHDMQILYESGSQGPGVTTVVRWCHICGAASVDTDVDNRTKPGQIQWPQIARFNQVPFGGRLVTDKGGA